MAEGQSKFKKIFNSRATLFLLLLAFLWLCVNVVNIFYKKYKINKQIEEMKAQIAAAEKSNQQISQMLDYLGSKNFLEKEAREKLNLKKEGEEVVIVEPPKDLLGTSSAGENKDQVQINQDNPNISQKTIESNFVKWWKFFFR